MASGFSYQEFQQRHHQVLSRHLMIPFWAYGYGGVWLTDAEMKTWKDFNKGLPKNVDGRNIRNMVQTKNGEIWCAAMMDVYRFDGKEWKMFPLADNDERIADITLTKDSTSIIAITRSAVYEISGKKTDATNEKDDARYRKDDKYDGDGIHHQSSG